MALEIFQGNVRSAPVWAGDFGGREHIVPFPAKIDPSQFTDQGGIQVQLTAPAAQGATSITVAALTLAALASTILIAQGDTLIPAGTPLLFGGPSSGKIAVTSAPALYGATTIPVYAIPVALAGTELADYSKYGVEFLPSGIPVGRTYASRTTGGLFVPADPVNHDEIYLTMFDTPYASVNSDVELYRHNSLVKENYLPNYTTVLNPAGVASALLVKLRTLYVCELGQD